MSSYSIGTKVVDEDGRVATIKDVHHSTFSGYSYILDNGQWLDSDQIHCQWTPLDRADSNPWRPRAFGG